MLAHSGLTTAQERTEGIDGAMLQQQQCVNASICWVAGVHACLRDQLLLPSPGLPCKTAHVLMLHIPKKNAGLIQRSGWTAYCRSFANAYLSVWDLTPRQIIAPACSLSGAHRQPNCRPEAGRRAEQMSAALSAVVPF